MSRRFHRGLVVGKFCPLHRGHEHLIRRAMEACIETIVISYTKPEFPGCGPDKRRRWLKSVFPGTRILVPEDGVDGLAIPNNDDDDRTHRRFVGHLCREILGVTVDTVFTSEDYGNGFAAELTRQFRETQPDHPDVQHVCVDPLRLEHPVSGTQLRQDVHSHRHWLPPVVYADFVQRVCLLGGESSGKSTLAATLSSRFETLHVAEYGRDLWEQRDGILGFDDMLQIAETQIAGEDAAAGRANRYLFCDTSPLTTLFYCCELFGSAAPELEDLAARPYDLTILCAPDFPFIQDGTRRDAGFRTRQHRWYLDRFAKNGTRFVLVGGSVEERVRQAGAVLRDL